MSLATLFRQVCHTGAFFFINGLSRLAFSIAAGKSLSASEYGTYSLIGTVVAMLLVLSSMGAPQYYSREIPGRPRAAGAILFKGVVGVQMLISVGLACLIFLVPFVAEPSWRAVGLPTRLWPILALGGLLILEGLVTDIVRYLYARKDIENGNVAMFLQTGLWPLIVFLTFLISPSSVTLNLVYGVWLGSLCAAAAFGLASSNPRELWDSPFQPRVYLTALRFGAPLMLSYALAAGDWLTRLALVSWHSTGIMGSFAYHSNVILMIAAITGPLISTPLDPYVIEAHNAGRPERSSALLSMMLRYRLMLLIPMIAVIITWDDRLIALLAREDFARMSGLLILLAPIPFLGVVANTLEKVLFLEKRTVNIGWCYVGAAVIQVALVMSLVPNYPLAGAAIASSAGLAALSGLFWITVRRATNRLDVQWGRLAIAGALCLSATWVTAPLLFPVMEPVVALALNMTIAVVSFLAAAIVVRAISRGEIQSAWQLVNGGRRRLAAIFAGGL